MTITERARADGIPVSTAMGAARRIGIAAGRDIPDYEWGELVSSISEGNRRPRSVLKLDAAGTVIAKYNTIAEAARQSGTYSPSIVAVCRGRKKSAGGFFWKYTDE